TFDGMGVTVKVVDFTAGNDYFTCKITGTPKKSGHGTLTVKLSEEHTSAGVMMSSMSNAQKGFGFSTPDENTNTYISTQSFACKLGYMIDTSDTPSEIEMTQGYSTDYCLYGNFKKDQDVSNLVSGLPSGVKAYSLDTVSNPAILRVYFKGVPKTAATYQAYADISGTEYAQKASSSSVWTTSSGAESHVSSYTDTYVTFSVSTASEAGFAYSYRLDPNDDGTGAVSGLPYEELKTLTDTEPIFLRGNISTKQFVEVKNAKAGIGSKSVYTGIETEIWLYIPQITFSRDYTANLSTVNDFVRLMKVNESGNITDGPITGYTITTETAISKGKQTGVNILIYISGIAAGASSCFDGLQLQVYDGSSWKNIKMPTGSEYEIGEVITGNIEVTLSNYNGLTASIADCSVNGFSWQSLNDRLGVEVSVSGATYKTLHKGNDVTSWFTNLPAGMSAVVKEDATAGSTTVKIRFGKVNPRTWKIGPVTPTEVSSANILVTVPFSALAESKFADVDGGIVAAVNSNAKYNIIESSQFGYLQKGMITSVEYAGEYRNGGPMGDTDTTEYSTIYIPGYLLEGYNYTKPMLRLTLTSQNDDIVNYNHENLIMIESTVLNKSSNDSYNIYYGTADLYLPMVTANRIAENTFTIVKAEIFEYGGEEPPAEESFKEIDLLPAYIKYKIVKAGTTLDTGDEVEEQDDNGSGNGGSGSLDSKGQPDIWINGKDNKKAETYYKSMSKELTDLIDALPDGCKYIASVTDTTVEDVADAFGTGGKAKKSNTAKVSIKAKDGKVVVTAGKTAGIVRVWVAAYDSKNKKIEASNHFDVKVGIAPKKLYLTKDSTGEKSAAVKSIILNKGETGTVFVNADGAELSPYSSFTWEAPKDTDGLLTITPASGKHQSANISVNS
ncbi:MAG: hypothetical protein J5824_08005, partial [Lachnospiraceae bacterium]|nr:hypothetical protein [Lachnospiraceae bacterium]